MSLWSGHSRTSGRDVCRRSSRAAAIPRKECAEGHARRHLSLLSVSGESRRFLGSVRNPSRIRPRATELQVVSVSFALCSAVFPTNIHPTNNTTSASLCLRSRHCLRSTCRNVNNLHEPHSRQQISPLSLSTCAQLSGSIRPTVPLKLPPPHHRPTPGYKSPC